MSAALPRARRERGAAMPFALGLALLCAGIAAASTLRHASAQREASTTTARERSFQAADGGVDWAIGKVRAGRGALPSPTVETRSIDGTASFRVQYTPGTSDGLDEDGDGTVDEADEADYVLVTSTGIAGGARRTVRVITSRRIDLPAIETAAAIATDLPVLTITGNSCSIAGLDHRLDGSLDPMLAERPAVTTEGDAASLAAQVPAGREDQVIGLGAEPSVAVAAPLDVDALYAQFARAATVLLESGTHTHANYGTATASGMAVVVCDGDLHVAGNSGGAGVLLVRGDLEVGGSFVWTGLVLVTGRVRFTGTGATEKLLGAVIAGEELEVAGNAELCYSSAAVALAKQALAVPDVVSWVDAALR